MMKTPAAIQIDFAPLSLSRTLMRVRLHVWLMAVIGLCLCLAAAVHIISLRSASASANTALQAALDQKIKEAHAHTPAPQIPLPPAEVQAMNAAIVRLNTPWSDLLDTLESATPANIALISLEPDSRKNSLKGVAEAKSAEDMIRTYALTEDVKCGFR